MKKIIFSLIVLSFLIGGLSVLAQDNDLPSSGLTPDSPFYFFKSWKESIQLFFTFGEENKAKQFLHLSEVRLAEYQKMVEKGKTEIAQKTLEKYEKQLNHALEKADQAQEKGKDVEKLKETISEKILKHQEVLGGVLEKVPEEAKEGIEKAIEVSQKGFEKAIEAVTGEKKEELQRKAGEIQTRLEEKIEAVCIQVITPAIGPENICKEFGTPCDVPTGYERVVACPKPASSPTPSASPTPLPTPTPSPSPIPIPAPTPTPAEKFACCNQEACKLMAYEECFTAGGQRRIGVSSCSPNPCIVTGPKKYPSGNCTPGEVINYKCADGTSFKWCVCDDLGWDCPMYKYANRLCPATKEVTLETGQHVPATCTLGEAINYKCADGTIVRACICEELGNTGTTAWECGLEPICPQPGPPTVASVSISGAVTSDLPVELQTTPFGTVRIVWMASEPVTSRLEYGPTTSYGSTAGTDYFGSTYQGAELPNLQPNTTYHFRIRVRDKDIAPNTAVTEDYTFIIRKLPDLAIFPISVDHFNADTPNKIHVNIQNNGVALAAKGFVVKVYVDDILAGEGTYDSDLAVGASGEKTIDYTFSGAKSYAVIKAVVDATNLVTELNENNNGMQYSMSIYPPAAGQ